VGTSRGLPRAALVAFFFGSRLVERVYCYIDGFNLYHSLASLKQDHFKWVNLWKLASYFLDPKLHELSAVYYFSAYATWRPSAFRRHKEYVRALRAVGVVPVMSEFYEKTNWCTRCHASWNAHEEKQSDVKIALWMLDHAYRDRYDRALLISRDSDLTPAVRMIGERFPEKKIYVIAPPNRRHSKELAKTVPRKHLKSVKQIHIEKALFGDRVLDPDGKLAAVRPEKYDPEA
jgi:uncharacterized LabA/DUF88 family protein